MGLAVAAVLVVPVLVFVGGDRPGPGTTPADDGSSRQRGTPTPWVSPDHTAPEADSVLVFDDGQDGVITVDFDRGVIGRSALPGQRPGDRPFRLSRLGDRLIVGSQEIWAVELGSGTTRRLGAATRFVPDARADRLWLVDEPLDAATSPTWTLIDGSGSVLHRTTGRAGMVPVRGVPGGLALLTEDGLKVYDVATERIFFYVDAPHGRIGDVAGDRVAWCRPGCHRLTVRGPDTEPSSLGSDEVVAFETARVWLSPDGTHVAAVARSTTPGTGVVRQVLVFDAYTGQVRARHRLPAGDVRGGWSVGGHRYFFAATTRDGTQRLGRYRLGRTGFEIRDLRTLGTVESFVALPRASVVG